MPCLRPARARVHLVPSSPPFSSLLLSYRRRWRVCVVRQTVKGFDLAMAGLCEGTKATITVPAALGFDEPNAKAARPPEVPVGSALRYDVEIIKILRVAPDGVPYRPCFFSLIDADGSGDLDELELARHFTRVKQQVPPHVMQEDTDGDGRISFDEYVCPSPACPSPACPSPACPSPAWAEDRSPARDARGPPRLANSLPRRAPPAPRLANSLPPRAPPAPRLANSLPRRAPPASTRAPWPAVRCGGSRDDLYLTALA